MIKNFFVILFICITSFSSLFFEKEKKIFKEASSINFSFWFQLQEYFFKFDENGKIKDSYLNYEKCSSVTDEEIEFYRNQINNVSNNLSEEELKNTKSKVYCWFINPLNKLINFVLYMILIHFLIIFVLDLSKLSDKIETWQQTYKSFFKFYFFRISILIGLLTGIFSIFIFPLETIYDLIFWQGKILSEYLLKDFINIIKGL